MNEALPELPAMPAKLADLTTSYMEDSIKTYARAYALAAIQQERERAAQIVESMEPLAGAIVHDIARAIRATPPPHRDDATQEKPAECWMCKHYPIDTDSGRRLCPHCQDPTWLA